jgi:hypothetical protein
MFKQTATTEGWPGNRLKILSIATINQLEWLPN